MKLSLLEPGAPGSAAILAGLWNAALGPGMQVSERLVRFNTQPAGGAESAVCLAGSGSGQAAGFALASAVTRPETGLDCSAGWIEALAVVPGLRGQGAGSALLAWGEAWLRGRGCRSARLGGGLRPFTPGLPAGGGSQAFFSKHGYLLREEHGVVWDVARSLEDYTSPAFLRAAALEVRPLEPGEAPEMAAFLGSEFPGRWHYEFLEHLGQGGEASDYLALRLGGDMQGFCQVTVERSLRPLERFYLHGLPLPWGQLGPIGVGAAVRGRGLGEGLLDAGLRHLKALGVNGCVIDWVSRPAFYQKFGFRLHREYQILAKELERHG